MYNKLVIKYQIKKLYDSLILQSWPLFQDESSFSLLKVGKGTAVVGGAATVAGALTGKVRYACSGSKTASIGALSSEFEVTYFDEAVQTFPNNGFISIEITDDLA